MGHYGFMIGLSDCNGAIIYDWKSTKFGDIKQIMTLERSCCRKSWRTLEAAPSRWLRSGRFHPQNLRRPWSGMDRP
jgi:hypothetical protein